jgi:hypothetical protein
MKDFSYYKECFSTLHTAKSKGFFAPHKPLLLLSAIDLVEIAEQLHFTEYHIVKEELKQIELRIAALA